MTYRELKPILGLWIAYLLAPQIALSAELESVNDIDDSLLPDLEVAKETPIDIFGIGDLALEMQKIANFQRIEGQLPEGGVERASKVEALVQIKVQVIEVIRSDGSSANSVLDFSDIAGDGDTLISGNNVNGDMRGLSGGTRFSVAEILGLTATGSFDSGSGLLVNLTKKHINLIASFLAAELNATIVTAPAVVTLNNNEVKFFTGSKVPLPLGETAVVGSAAVTREFYYKHIGTYVGVTPEILPNGSIRLDITVRLADSAFTPDNAPFESGVVAIENVVEVKSGNGFVMAGLIGEDNSTAVSKVPVLGSIPLVGALFRSKRVRNSQTETVILVEARIASDPEAVKLWAKVASTAAKLSEAEKAVVELKESLPALKKAGKRAELAVLTATHESNVAKQAWEYAAQQVAAIRSMIREEQNNLDGPELKELDLKAAIEAATKKNSNTEDLKKELRIVELEIRALKRLIEDLGETLATAESDEEAKATNRDNLAKTLLEATVGSMLSDNQIMVVEEELETAKENHVRARDENNKAKAEAEKRDRESTIYKFEEPVLSKPNLSEDFSFSNEHAEDESQNESQGR